MKKKIPKIWQPEGNKKNYSRNSGTRFRGFHSREWTGTGIPAHPYSLFSTEREKTSNSSGSYFGAGHITKSKLTLVRRAMGCPKREGVKCDELAFKDKFRDE